MKTDRGGTVWLAAFAATLTLPLTACQGRVVLEELDDGLDCRRTVLVGHPAAAADTLASDSARQALVRGRSVDWALPAESLDVVQLNAWCAGVGPAVVGGWGSGGLGQGQDFDFDIESDLDPDSVDGGGLDSAGVAIADTLWLVSWNVHVGGGDLRGLVEDLREGRLTEGRRVEHFVLLLQEAYRGGDLIPAYDAEMPGGSGVTGGPPEGPREDILELAERLELWLMYAPSMRNGEDEDRGNAILSTLPLHRPVAIELPVARQRRVAVVAEVMARTRGGRDWRLQVANVHLESHPSGWASDEGQRLEQAEALLSLLPESASAVAAGDFNTQTRGQDEALVRPMLRAYPDTPRFPTGPTYEKAFGLYRQYLDYIFFRLPDNTPARYDRVPQPYASDHYPLVGWIAW